MWETLVIAKNLTNVTFLCYSQPVRNQSKIKNNHKCNLINACNIIYAFQQNKPVENWDRVKYCQQNKFPNKMTITNSY